jgi:hypothetical protein
MRNGIPPETLLENRDLNVENTLCMVVFVYFVQLKITRNYVTLDSFSKLVITLNT